MQSITITIDTKNPAFRPKWESETARILRTIATRIEMGTEPESERDYNGNRVATIKYAQ